jgi:hypothetical protein
MSSVSSLVESVPMERQREVFSPSKAFAAESLPGPVRLAREVCKERDMNSRIEPTIVFTSGETAPLCIAFLWEMLRSTRFKLLVVATIGLFALIHPYQPLTLQRWEIITIIAVVGLMVFICYLSVFLFFVQFSQRLGLRYLRTVWLLFATSLLASFAGQLLLPIFGETPNSVAETLLVWVFHFMVFTGLEIIFSTLVLPEIMVGLQSASKRQAEVQPPTVADQLITDGPGRPVSEVVSTVIISDKKFDPKSIKWVMAEAHYISISTFDDQTHFVRGRLRDFLAQVSDDLGFAIHRSYWVAWASIQQIEVEKDSMTVILDEKTSLPVARDRRTDFMDEWKRREAA